MAHHDQYVTIVIGPDQEVVDKLASDFINE